MSIFSSSRKVWEKTLAALAIAFSAKNRTCGPEARALRGKSIGGKRNACGDHPVFPQSEAGL